MHFNHEKYPDGISEPLKFLDHEERVWDRGYYCKVENGCWYELYVNDTIKSEYPNLTGDVTDINSIAYAFRGFQGLWIGDYEENNQITFFEPSDEKTWNYAEMTDIFI